MSSSLMLQRLFVLLVLGIGSFAAPSHAAVVTFSGVFSTGTAGDLDPLPRDFVLSLTYTENLAGDSTPAVGTFDFLEKPPQPQLIAPTSGTLTVTEAANPAANDVLTYIGTIPGQILSPANQVVNVNFTFTQPAGTIDDNFASEENIEKLIVGQATFTLMNNQINAGGSTPIQKAPEPGSTLALLGLIACGSGIGFLRRRRQPIADADAGRPE